MQRTVTGLEFETKESIQSIIKKMEEGEIALPFFQRAFEWKLSEMKGLLVSLFLGLPIGSFLILEDEKWAFATRSLEGIARSSENPKEFLLDGQQRLTTLYSVFNRIDSQATKRKILTHRWFVDLNLFYNTNEKDIEKMFDYDLQKLESEDIEDFFIIKEYTSNNIIYFKDYDDEDFRGKCKDEYIVPLDIFYKIYYDKALEDKLTNILTDISNKLNSDVSTKLKTDEDREKLKTRLSSWIKNVDNYIRSVLEIKIPILKFKSSQFSRAIQAFEILNKSGIKLHVFDLLVARAGRFLGGKNTDPEGNIENFYNIVSDKYGEIVKHDVISNIIDFKLEEDLEWSISWFDNDGTSPSKNLKDIIVNALTLLVSKEKDKDKDKDYNLSKNYLFSLDIEDSSLFLNKKIMPTMQQLQRAFIFLQFRCGLRNINDLHYKLIVLPIALNMINGIWNNKQKLNLIEAWYWTTILSGRYEYNQSEVTKNEIRILSEILNGNKESIKYAKIMDRNEEIQKPYIFPKMDLDYFKKCFSSSGIYKTIIQFILSRRPKDFFTEKKLESWSKESKKYEEHHIIPLTSNKKFSESTKDIRKSKDDPANSILNITLITKESNRKIGGMKYEDYKKEIYDSTLAEHFIHDLIAFDPKGNIIPDNFESFLSNRYKDLKRAIQDHVKKLIE